MNKRRAIVGEICFAFGGALLVASAFLHWIRHGPGSALRGHDLIDAIARVAHHTKLGGWQLTALTLVWYAIPASGALAWITIGFGNVRGISGKLTTALALITTATTIITMGTRLQWSHLGLGAYAAMLGTAAITAPLLQRARQATPIR